MPTEDDFGEEGARPSSLIPVHKLSTRDPLHDMQLLRDVAIINEQVWRELGPPPRHDPPSPRAEKEESMTPRQVAMATIIGAGAATANACVPSTHPLRETHKIDAVLRLQKVPEVDAATRTRLNLQPAKWPLKFKEHTFTAVCYSTQICRIWYAGAWSGHEELSPPSSEYGPNYLDHILGGHVGIANFPDPAEVTWRSMDGAEHQALIDIGAIFHDEVARHNVPREEVADLVDGKPSGNPQILLEVNDRTIRVYIRTYVPTKHFQIPGNPYSSSRDELILAKTYYY